MPLSDDNTTPDDAAPIDTPPAEASAEAPPAEAAPADVSPADDVVAASNEFVAVESHNTSDATAPLAGVDDSEGGSHLVAATVEYAEGEPETDAGPEPTLVDTGASESAVDDLISAPAAVDAAAPFAAVDDTSEFQIAPSQPLDFSTVPSAGVRADRRVRAGIRLQTQFGVGVVAVAAVPAALVLAALVAYPAPPESAKAAPLPPLDVTAAEDALERTQQTLDETIAERNQVALALLEQQALNQVPVLLKEIAVARDARRSNGVKGSGLSRPFTSSELGKAKKALGIGAASADSGSDSVRLLVRRNTTVVFGDKALLPSDFDLASTTNRLDATSIIASGRMVARVCVPREKLCIVETAPLKTVSAPVDTVTATLATTKAIWAAAQAAQSATESVPSTPAAEIHSRQVLAAVAAFLLGLFGSALLVMRFRREVTAKLSDLEQRANTLAQGRQAARANLNRAPEFDDAEDALDSLAAALEAEHRLREEAGARGERLVVLADTLDAVARGQTQARVAVEGTVAEQALCTATNRVADALERHAARLQSHLRVLDSGDNAPDETRESLARRVSALKPLPPLIADIGHRLNALAASEPASTKPSEAQRDLAKLADAISQRARTAHSLLAALEREVESLPRGTLAPSQAKALDHLRDDLRSFATSPALPTLLWALSTGPEALPYAEVRARIAN